MAFEKARELGLTPSELCYAEGVAEPRLFSRRSMPYVVAYFSPSSFARAEVVNGARLRSSTALCSSYRLATRGVGHVGDSPS